MCHCIINTDRKHFLYAVIGNPPYVEYSSIKYSIKNYDTIQCGNLYAFVIERTLAIMHRRSINGMIIPHSSVCTDRMKLLLDILQSNKLWISFFGIRPSKLFDGAEQRLCIFIFTGSDKETFSTKYYRWHNVFRPYLFQSIQYVSSTNKTKIAATIPKISSGIDLQILEKLTTYTPLSMYAIGSNALYYNNAPRYWIRATNFLPYFHNEKGDTVSSSTKRMYFDTEEHCNSAILLLNSSLFYFWYIAMSDCRHLNTREINAFPSSLNFSQKNLLQELMEDYLSNKQRKETTYKTTGLVVYDEFYPKKSKNILDRVDTAVLSAYCITESELDYIITYDEKYRLGESDD